MGRRKWAIRALALLLSGAVMAAAAGCGKKASESEGTKSSSVEETKKPESANQDDTNQIPEEKPVVSTVPHLVRKVYRDSTYHGSPNGETDEFAYEGILVSEECQEQFAALANALKQRQETDYAALRQEYDGMMKDRDSITEGEEVPYYICDKSVSTVVRADDLVVSLKSGSTFYNGGAHGYYGTLGDTYEVKSGKKLALTDVVSQEEAFKTALMNEMLENCFPYDEEDRSEERRTRIQSYLNDYPDLSDDTAYPWVMGYEGITVYFNPYTLFSYAEGMQVVHITFSEYPELFRESYTRISDRYVTEISFNEEMQVDLNGDGTTEKFSVVDCGPDEYGNYSHEILAVDLNEKRTEFDVSCYEMSAFLVKAAREKSFLYVFGRVENDYVVLRVISLNGEPGEAEDYLMSPAWITSTEEYWLSEAFSDPDYVIMEEHVDLLSTYWGKRPYRVGEDGLPVGLQEWLTLHEDARLTLTALRNMEVKVVDEAGTISGDREIEKGEKCRIYRTDGKSYVDLKLTDGSLIRVFTQGGEWPRKVNGMDEEEVFEGMLYAG